MNCESYRTLLSGHLDGVNTKTEEESLRSHLNTCADCRAHLTALRKNDEVLKGSAVQPPQELTRRIMQKVSSAPQKKKSKRRWIAVVAPSLAAAALAVVFFGRLGLPTQDQAARETASAQDIAVAKEAVPEAGAVQTYNLSIPAVSADAPEKRKAVVTQPALLIVHADRSQLDLNGEALSPVEAKKLLEEAELSANGATAAYLVSFEELESLVQTYDGIFEMEKKYSAGMEYQTALVLLTQ